jgi:hypothetical protein
MASQRIAAWPVNKAYLEGDAGVGEVVALQDAGVAHLLREVVAQRGRHVLVGLPALLQRHAHARQQLLRMGGERECQSEESQEG